MRRETRLWVGRKLSHRKRPRDIVFEILAVIGGRVNRYVAFSGVMGCLHAERNGRHGPTDLFTVATP